MSLRPGDGAQVANPVSNAIYARLGYVRVGREAEVTVGRG